VENFGHFRNLFFLKDPTTPITILSCQDFEAFLALQMPNKKDKKLGNSKLLSLKNSEKQS
jgi:hypothetical protein